MGKDDLELHPTAHYAYIFWFRIADGYYYHKGHGWARIEHGGFVRLGVDDFAWKLLGPTGMSLPKIGAKLKPNQTGWSIRRGELPAELLSPMSGTVMATNQNALQHPDLIKKDPYGKGWLVLIDPGSGLRVKTKNLLFEQKAVSWLNSEVKKLEEVVMNVYGVPLAAAPFGVLIDALQVVEPGIILFECLH